MPLPTATLLRGHNIRPKHPCSACEPALRRRLLFQHADPDGAIAVANGGLDVENSMEATSWAQTPFVLMPASAHQGSLLAQDFVPLAAVWGNLVMARAGQGARREPVKSRLVHGGVYLGGGWNLS
ncbi:hypothetical protein HaLaN_20483 [Haematococcus lacustris]|uniref:Uncharacterized protein n=1 Tax=Haematococcus lacustris TaxID=44745 RepID=A0A699ZW92_HAELA|nr:hypothetical protein HaLaN_20483 [Haematococcus lacustris]